MKSNKRALLSDRFAYTLKNYYEMKLRIQREEINALKAELAKLNDLKNAYKSVMIFESQKEEVNKNE